MKNAIKKILITAVLVVSLNGCAISVMKGNPRPNIDIDPSDQKLTIMLDDSIQNAFVIPRQAALAEVQVTQWRDTLVAGFNTGFGSYFNMVPSDGDLVIQLVRTDLSFAPKAVTAEGISVAIAAQITFQARLLDSQGNILSRTNGTISAKQAITNSNEATANVVSALETMFEQIAMAFFGNQEPAQTQSPDVVP
ncbi:MAG: hypothetical protein GY854_07450 [Deltaproteobacteria bacterium]|nr:hypothetical protein [Deltaproteobacteria bacterium]